MKENKEKEKPTFCVQRFVVSPEVFVVILLHDWASFKQPAYQRKINKMRRILPTFAKLNGNVFRPISLVVLISFDNQSNSAIKESKFSNNPFHFYFASLPFLPKTIVNLVNLLKWLYHAFRYFFKKLNLSSHQWTWNTGPVLLFKTIFRQRNCFLSTVAKDGKDGNGLKLERVGPAFSSFNAIPTKMTQKLLRLVLSDEIYMISF